MRCSGCAAENAPDCRFCSECGARLVSICPSCRFENAPAAKFCGGCGARLTGAAAPAVTQPAPESYTPKPLAERILRSRGALEGERKQVTVLFADIKGSMELIQSADPEDARRILDPTIEAMMRAVHRYEGTVNKVLGDGIMALFGAPIAHEDHAVRACYAALAIQNALREIAEKIRRDFGVEVQVRTGLHSGEVVVRTIGNDLTMDYDAIGQTTHLASRMEQLALPGSIRMTADTLRLAEGLVQVRPLGPIPVKGLVQPIEVFELIGAAAVRSRLQASAVAGFTRFVGREREMHALVRFAHIAGGNAFTTAELYPRILAALSCPERYTLASLRYDLTKLRAKGLVAKLPRSRRYQLLPRGYSICLIFLKLFERVYAPLPPTFSWRRWL